MTSPLLSLIEYAKPFRPKIILASIYSVTNKLFDIAPEILIGIAIDVVVAQEKSFLAKFGVIDPWHQILLLGFLTFLIWLGESIFEYLLMISWRGLAQTIQHELRSDTYEHVQNLDLNFFEDQNTGNLVSILNDDVNQLERFLDGGVNSLIQTFTAVIGVGAVFFYISPLIGTIAFVPIPIVIFGAFFFQKKANPLYTKVRSSVGSLSSLLSNNLSGIMVIKSFAKEIFEAKKLREESQNYVDMNKKAISVSSAFIPVIRMAILSGFLATLIIGAKQVFAGEIAIGSYGILVFLTQRLLWPLTSLAATVDLYERAMSSTRRILGLLQSPIVTKVGSLKPLNIEGHFQIENLEFSYKTGPKILKGISLDIPAKETIAFVGATGSGKSTLIKILLNFYSPSDGKILLDGNNLADISHSTLRRNIGWVSQDVYLFHGTVKENIAYALLEHSNSRNSPRPIINSEAVIKAAKLAEAHDFIMNLPDKYETIVGERGQKLSGGQRQRISIARAILKNPPILILDEATSAIDNETEAAIQKSLAVISKNRTTIVVAHRLSTIVNADQIFVLENGKIAEAGTHNSLIANSGPYQKLWDVQTGATNKMDLH